MSDMLLSCCILVLLLTDSGFTAPTAIPEEESSPSPETEPDLKLATVSASLLQLLKEMQMFFGLNSTGVLDSETLQVMQSPRCGVPDVEEYSHIQGTRWNKNVLTYRIGRYTRDLRSSIVDSLIESAFSVWARASGLTFVRTHSHNADIMVDSVII
uniref:Matrix metallopeptidase 20b (enamelysin) n=1 Tax=Xiphophorus maculatus TaxID=8083 RepID=A0A3B5R8F3_XIPMA